MNPGLPGRSNLMTNNVERIGPMKQVLTLTGAAMALIAFSGTTAVASQAEIDEINARYDAAFNALQSDINEWQAEAPAPSEFEAVVDVNVEGIVTWEITDFSFDIPEIIFKTREFSLDLPQFKWDRTGFSMDIPEVFMAVTKVGEYPCFKGLKWYSCDIKTKVPQVRMVRKDFSLDLPQVWWDRTSFSMDIPEFFSKRVEVKMHLPQFKLESVSGQIGAYQAEGEAFAMKAEKLGKAQEAEIKSAVAADLEAQKSEVYSQFDGAIEALDKAISDLKAAGGDPAKVNTPEGVVNLIAMRADVLEKRKAALTQISAQIEQLKA